MSTFTKRGAFVLASTVLVATLAGAGTAFALVASDTGTDDSTQTNSDRKSEQRQQFRMLKDERLKMFRAKRDELKETRRSFIDSRKEYKTGSLAESEWEAIRQSFAEERTSIREEYKTARETWREEMKTLLASARADREAKFKDARDRIKALREEHFNKRCELLDQDDEVASGFGAAFNPLSARRELMLSVRCDNETGDATFEAGSEDGGQWVYRYGFKHDGDGWERFEFDTLEGERVGQWIKGKAFTDLEVEIDELADKQHLVAYICQQVDGRWKCGCSDEQCVRPKWQLQSTSPDVTDDTM